MMDILASFLWLQKYLVLYSLLGKSPCKWGNALRKCKVLLKDADIFIKNLKPRPVGVVIV